MALTVLCVPHSLAVLGAMVEGGFVSILYRWVANRSTGQGGACSTTYINEILLLLLLINEILLLLLSLQVLKGP